MYGKWVTFGLKYNYFFADNTLNGERDGESKTRTQDTLLGEAEQ